MDQIKDFAEYASVTTSACRMPQSWSHMLTSYSVPQEFVKEGVQFMNRCTKPDKVRNLDTLLLVANITPLGTLQAACFARLPVPDNVCNEFDRKDEGYLNGLAVLTISSANSSRSPKLSASVS